MKIEAMPLVKSGVALEGWKDLSSRALQEPGWRHVLGEARETPLYLQDPAAYYRLEYLPEAGLLYVQLNRADEMNTESIEVFSARVTAMLEAQPVRAVALDLRFNTGGNLELAKNTVADLEKRTRSLKRYLLIGAHDLLRRAAPRGCLAPRGQGDGIRGSAGRLHRLLGRGRQYRAAAFPAVRALRKWGAQLFERALPR